MIIILCLYVARGINTTVAQIQAQLDNANWELSQTAVRAPADGYVTAVALTVGDRAFQLGSAMSFIVESFHSFTRPPCCPSTGSVFGGFTCGIVSSALR